MTTKAKKTAIESTGKCVMVKPIDLIGLRFRIIGTSPLVVHNWSKKAMAMLRMTAAERRKVPKVARDPETEAEGATYRTADGRHGILAMAVKTAMITAAHKDMGLPRSVVMKAIRFAESGVIPLECEEPIIREDVVRVGMGATDLRYRPQYTKWAATIRMDYDAESLTSQDVINLVNRAGFSVGIGEWRAEKGGELGSFVIDMDSVEEIRTK